MPGENTEAEDKTEDKDDAVTPDTGDTNDADKSKSKDAEDTAEKGNTPPVDREDADKDKSESDATDSDGPKEFDKELWGETGDETADSVLQLLSESGVEPTDAKSLLWDAVQGGDPTKIDKETLVEKVGKVKANLIMSGVENYVTKQNSKQEAAVKAVHDAAGGKENWDTVLPWLNKSVSEEDRAEYSAMIDAGGKQAALAVQEIVRNYNADPKNKSLSAREVLGDGTSRKAEKGISRREYGDRLTILHRKGQANDEARAELTRLRRLGKQQGL